MSCAVGDIMSMLMRLNTEPFHVIETVDAVAILAARFGARLVDGGVNPHVVQLDEHHTTNVEVCRFESCREGHLNLSVA